MLFRFFLVIFAFGLFCCGGGAAEAVASETFSVLGIGGAGGIFSPSVSPYDPDFMLVGSDMSGVYYSHDGGEHWLLVPSRDLKNVAESRPPAYFKDRVYWYSRLSPVVSSDKGVTWNGVKWPWKPRRWVQGMTAVSAGRRYLFVATKKDLWRLDVDANDWTMVLKGGCLPPIYTGKDLLVSSKGRIMISRDLGSTWHPLDSSVESMGQIIAFAGAGDGAGSVLLATVKDKGVYRSTDVGASWEKVAEYNHQRIVQVPSGQTQSIWLMEQQGMKGQRLWKSSDGGDHWDQVFRYRGSKRNVTHSWVQKQMKWGYFFTQNGFYVSHANPDVAMVTTQGDFFITRDGGRSWKSIIGKDMGVLKDGVTPKTQSVGLEMTTCYQYLVDPWEPNRHYVAFTDIGFIRSLDSGKTWSYAAKGSPWPNSFYRVRFDPKVPGKMYAAASNRHDIPNWSQLALRHRQWNKGGVVVSTNFGASWAPLKGLPKIPCTDVLVYQDEASDSLVIFAALYGKGVFVSRDGGRTWADSTGNIPEENRHALRLWRDKANGDIYCLVTAKRIVVKNRNKIVAGGLWKSSDGGKSWDNLTQQTPILWPTAVAIDPANSDHMYLAVASIPARRPHYGGVWRTVDGGKNWEHVLKDKNFKWGYDRMMAVAIHPDDKSLIYAGGAGTGLWMSRDHGDKWKNVKKFPFMSVQGIDFNPGDHSQMFLTTFGAGAWVGPHLP